MDDVFVCRQCGQCCEGRGGIVLSEKDRDRLANFLDISREKLISSYCETSNGKLKIRTGPDGFCVFFRQGLSCTVHAGKPDICRAWPFFRGNLEDPLSLAMAKDFCPGIDKDASFEDFATIGLAWLETRGLVAADPQTEANALIVKNKKN